jgi:hypothetical protein
VLAVQKLGCDHGAGVLATLPCLGGDEDSRFDRGVGVLQRFQHEPDVVDVGVQGAGRVGEFHLVVDDQPAQPLQVDVGGFPARRDQTGRPVAWRLLEQGFVDAQLP